jgi:hypothetical protein
MPTEASFRSTAFNNFEPRPYFINDCCYGDDLAKWMIGRLRERGLKTDDEPGQEDFGWYFNFWVPEGWHRCVLGPSRGRVASVAGGSRASWASLA